MDPLMSMCVLNEGRNKRERGKEKGRRERERLAIKQGGRGTGGNGVLARR